MPRDREPMLKRRINPNMWLEGYLRLKRYLTAVDLGNSLDPEGAIAYRDDVQHLVIKANARWRKLLGWEVLSDAVGDGVTDDQPAIQAMIDWCIANNRRKLVIEMPSVEYKIGDTVKVGTGAALSCIHIYGDCGGYDPDGSMNGNKGVVFNASSFTDRPAVNVQGARNTMIEGITVKGANAIPQLLRYYPSSDVADYRAYGTYGQHNPYCGFSVDAYSGSAPAVPYTNDDYGRVHSGNVRFVDCNAWKFVVGFAIKPSSDNNNASSIVLRDCHVNQAAQGISVGGSQQRNVLVYNTNVTSCYSCVDTVTYGVQAGVCPKIRGGEWGSSFQLFNITAGSGASQVDGLYVESFCRIGNLGQAAQSGPAPMVFRDCHFAFERSDSDWINNGAAKPAVHMFISGPVKFVGTYLYNGRHGMINVSYSGGSLDFDSCTMVFVDGWDDHPYVGLIEDGGITVTSRNCVYSTPGFSLGAGTGDAFNTDSWYASFYQRIPFSFHSRTMQTWKHRYELRPPIASNKVGGNSSAHAWTASTLTFTTTATTLFQVDDVLYWNLNNAAVPSASYALNVPMLRVTGVTNGGATIACELLFDRDQYDETYTTVQLIPRLWAPRDPLVGTFTSGNTGVTFGAGIDPRNTLKVGDFIRSACTSDWTRVTAIDATTVTLNKNASASGDASITWGIRSELGKNLKSGTASDDGTYVTIDLTKYDVHELTLTGNRTIKFTSGDGDGYRRVMLRVTQGGAGSYTLTWPSGTKWASATAPTLSTTVGDVDMIEVVANLQYNFYYGHTYGLDMG